MCKNAFIKNKLFPFTDFEYLKEQQLKAAILKIYWEPQLNITRKNGHFKMTLFEFTQKPEKQMIDLITMDYKNGTNLWYSFDTTDYLTENGNVNFFLQKSPVKVNKNGKMMEFLPLGIVTQAQLVVYTKAENTFGTLAKSIKVKREAKRPRNKNK